MLYRHISIFQHVHNQPLGFGVCLMGSLMEGQFGKPSANLTSALSSSFKKPFVNLSTLASNISYQTRSSEHHRLKSAKRQKDICYSSLEGIMPQICCHGVSKHSKENRTPHLASTLFLMDDAIPGKASNKCGRNRHEGRFI